MLEIPGILGGSIRRRDFLRLGAFGATAAWLNQSLALGDVLHSPNAIRSCILVMLYGGPSQLDTWDMKPHATAEVRGEYKPIQTCIPGRFVCEHLPQCAKRLDKLCVVRTMHHGMANHNSAMYQTLIGRRPKTDLDVLGADRATDFPCVGSVVSHLSAIGKLRRSTNPLTNVALPHVMHNVVDLPGQNAGFLGGQHDPLQVTSDPNSAGFHVNDLRLPADMTTNRLHNRLALLQAMQQNSHNVGLLSQDSDYRRAFDLLQNDVVSRAFQIERESDQMRDRYGRNTLGQSLLLARKLVEAGVRFINVNDKVYNGQDANWDSHANLFARHRELLSPFDQGFSALIEDLDQRGLLDSTLVIVTGEFGRTPRVNTSGGRDHWPDCYSAVVAGGGVAAGSTYGESDRTAAYPLTTPVTPGDVVATILWRFGIDPRLEIHDPLGRPIPLAEGSPLRAIFTSA
ncbi:MAG: DUF1501 domain-containing protein [Planctomycetales bacterium]|nr:DUF1501 domain-containing protein [Planctomycetales bacterium]MCA9168412.1 DUF1501 domain-containing protein [Planctomycetales bacterium]